MNQRGLPKVKFDIKNKHKYDVWLRRICKAYMDKYTECNLFMLETLVLVNLARLQNFVTKILRDFE